MSKEEFEIGYCEGSEITIEEYHNEYNQITLPCNCGEEGCQGWAAVTNIPLAVKAHVELYS